MYSSRADISHVLCIEEEVVVHKRTERDRKERAASCHTAAAVVYET